MKILLAGASGFIGANLARALRTAGHAVVPVSRRDGIDVRRLRTPADWSPLLDGVDAAINCIGIIGERAGQTFADLHATAPQALFRACAARGVRRVVQVSALGADRSAFSAYHLSKREADDCLRGLDLEWFVLRPSLIYGRGGGSAELLLRLARLPMLPVLDGGDQTLYPVHVADVVDTIARCLKHPAPRQTVDIVGPQAVSFLDWLRRMRAAQGLPPAPTLRVPYHLALAAAAFAGRLNPIMQTDLVRMLHRGYLADDRALRMFLGRPARACQDALFFRDAAEAAALATEENPS